MRVFRLGNDLAVHLPKTLVDRLGLKDGDELDVVAADKSRVDVETREARRQRALAGLASLNWTLPEGYRFDRNGGNER